MSQDTSFRSLLDQVYQHHQTQTDSLLQEIAGLKLSVEQITASLSESQELNRVQTLRITEQHLLLTSKDAQITHLSQELLSIRRWRDDVLSVVGSGQLSNSAASLDASSAFSHLPASHLSNSSSTSSSARTHLSSLPSASTPFHQPAHSVSSSDAPFPSSLSHHTSPIPHAPPPTDVSLVEHAFLSSPSQHSPPPFHSSPPASSPSHSSSPSSSALDDTFNLDRSIFADHDSLDESFPAAPPNHSLNHTFPTSSLSSKHDGFLSSSFQSGARNSLDFSRVGASGHSSSPTSFSSLSVDFSRESAFFDEARRCLSEENFASLLSLVKTYTTQQLLQPASKTAHDEVNLQLKNLLGSENEHLYHWLMRLFTPSASASASSLLLSKTITRSSSSSSLVDSLSALSFSSPPTEINPSSN